MSTMVTRGDRQIKRRTLWAVRAFTALIILGAFVRTPSPSAPAMLGVGIGVVIAGSLWYLGLLRLFSKPVDNG